MPLDAVLNPYTPGAGQPPAFLSGRERELTDFQARLQRLENGRGAQCTLIVGLRGVGKTVLLNEFARTAQTRGWVVVEYELTADSNLVGTMSRLVRQAVLEIAEPGVVKRSIDRVWRSLQGVEATYSIAGLTLGVTMEAHPPVPASGDAAHDMTDLLVALGEAAGDDGRGVAIMRVIHKPDGVQV